MNGPFGILDEFYAVVIGICDHQAEVAVVVFLDTRDCYVVCMQVSAQLLDVGGFEGDVIQAVLSFAG